MMTWRLTRSTQRKAFRSGSMKRNEIQSLKSEGMFTWSHRPYLMIKSASWSSPRGLGKDSQTRPPKFSDLCDYLAAFYHGAVVSTARYNPDLDESQSIERAHAWPLSHCAEYMSACCSTSMPRAKRHKNLKSEPANAHQLELKGPEISKELPLASLDAAFTRSITLSKSKMSQESLTALWLGRICRTTSHELGHCFGIDHCVYYACCMQGTSCLCEDARQPPYLCPVDQAKLLYFTEVTEAQRN